MASKVQLIGGNFQDLQGNVLNLGYLTMKLSSDEEVNDSLICSGIEIKINLDSSGNCVAGQYVWGNDVLLPLNSYYKVTAYTAAGQIAWGPNNQQVMGSSSFDVGTWIPNQVISWSPSVQSLLLEVNGTPNVSQTLLNFVNSGTVSFTNSGGNVSATASGGLVPAGQNVVSIPWNRTTVIGAGFNSGVTEASGTAVMVFPAPVIQAYPLLWKITLEVSDPSIPFDNMVLARTATSSLTVIDVTTITFGGSATPTLSAGVNVSDAISLQIDAAHDYYFMAHTSSGSPHNTLVARGMGSQFFGGVMGNGFTDNTHVSPIQNPVIPAGLESGVWISAWQSA
jgi:hypothetical protein